MNKQAFINGYKSASGSGLSNKQLAALIGGGIGAVGGGISGAVNPQLTGSALTDSALTALISGAGGAGLGYGGATAAPYLRELFSTNDQLKADIKKRFDEEMNSNRQ